MDGAMSVRSCICYKDCNGLVAMDDDQCWLILSSFAKATSKETSISADCCFLPEQMKSDLRTTTAQQDAY